MIDWSTQSALRWDCKVKDCFNIKARPKLRAFDECFPGDSAMGDVDGMVEIGGRFLFLEWKRDEGLNGGQRFALQRLTALSPMITVVVVWGDPASMAVEWMMVIHAGGFSLRRRQDLDGLKRWMTSWAEHARPT